MPISPAPYSRDYEITDAMFGAFRSPGGAKFFWKLTALLTAAYTIIFLIFLPLLSKSYGRLIVASVDNEVGVVMRESLFIFPLAMVFGVVAIAANACIRAAFYRTYFFDAPTDGFPLQFSQDEVRQTLAGLGFYGVVMALCFAVSIGMGVLVALLGGIMGDSAALLIGSLAVLSFGGFIIVLYWIMLRLCPAGALTALRGTTHVLAARHVSKGRVGALLGSIFVAGLIGYVVYHVCMIIGVMAGLSGFLSADMMSALSANDDVAVVEAARAVITQPGFRVGVVIAFIFMAAGGAFYQMMLVGPQAFFTRQWAEAGAETL